MYNYVISLSRITRASIDQLEDTTLTYHRYG